LREQARALPRLEGHVRELTVAGSVEGDDLVPDRQGVGDAVPRPGRLRETVDQHDPGHRR
jgi:hypothetical protein